MAGKWSPSLPPSPTPPMCLYLSPSLCVPPPTTGLIAFSTRVTRRPPARINFLLCLYWCELRVVCCRRHQPPASSSLQNNLNQPHLTNLNLKSQILATKPLNLFSSRQHDSIFSIQLNDDCKVTVETFDSRDQ